MLTFHRYSVPPAIQPKIRPENFHWSSFLYQCEDKDLQILEPDCEL